MSTVPDFLWFDGHPWDDNEQHEIPREAFRILEPDEDDPNSFPTRRQAEDAVAHIFAKVYPTPPSHDR